MDWKRKFKNIILERGRYYYTHNYVQNLTYDDHIYRARVLGDYAYAVEIKIRNNDIIYMKCSCPHAAKGNYCKHMAAVMFAIEKKGDSLKQLQLDFRESWVHPFESAVDTYQFFDMGRIAGILRCRRGF